MWVAGQAWLSVDTDRDVLTRLCEAHDERDARRPGTGRHAGSDGTVAVRPAPGHHRGAPMARPRPPDDRVRGVRPVAAGGGVLRVRLRVRPGAVVPAHLLCYVFRAHYPSRIVAIGRLRPPSDDRPGDHLAPPPPIRRRSRAVRR